MHVLDHHGEPAGPGGRGEQFGDAGEHALALPAPRPGLGLLQAGEQPHRLGLRVGRDSGQRVGQQGAVLDPAQRVERLGYRQERQLLGQRQAGAPHGPHLAQALGHEPRLADPGVARHEHQPRPPGQRGTQIGQLAAPASEGPHTPEHNVAGNELTDAMNPRFERVRTP